MRRIVVAEFLTLDGVMEDPGGAEKTPHGGWSVPYWNDEIAKIKAEEFTNSDAMLLGRVTYQGFAAAWPSRKDEGADKINSMPKFVVSTSLKKLEWKNSHLIKPDIVEEIRNLKRLPGTDILVNGSGMLVRTLMDADLVDEYRLLVYPVVLGAGKHLFRDAAYKPLKQSQVKIFDCGVTLLVYH
jgi:dihydrofolate reductase